MPVQLPGSSPSCCGHFSVSLVSFAAITDEMDLSMWDQASSPALNIIGSSDYGSTFLRSSSTSMEHPGHSTFEGTSITTAGIHSHHINATDNSTDHVLPSRSPAIAQALIRPYPVPSSFSTQKSNNARTPSYAEPMAYPITVPMFAPLHTPSADTCEIPSVSLPKAFVDPSPFRLPPISHLPYPVQTSHDRRPQSPQVYPHAESMALDSNLNNLPSLSTPLTSSIALPVPSLPLGYPVSFSSPPHRASYAPLPVGGRMATGHSSAHGESMFRGKNIMITGGHFQLNSGPTRKARHLGECLRVRTLM